MRSLIKTNREFSLSIIDIFRSDRIQVLEVIMDKGLKQLDRSKLLSIILEMIMLLIVSLFEFDELVPLLGYLIIMAVPQVE